MSINNMNLETEQGDSDPSKQPRVCGWANLPTDQQNLIASKISFVPLLHKLAVSCKGWLHAITQHVGSFPRSSPMILLPYSKTTKLTFFDLKDFETYSVKIPELHNHHILGSSKGWLVTINLNLDLILYNPLTRSRIPLPEHDKTEFTKEQKILEEDPSLFTEIISKCIGIRRMVISKNPSLVSNCFVATIFFDSDKLVVCRLGDKTWSKLQNEKPKSRRYNDNETNYRFIDFTFFEGRIYAVRQRGDVAIINYNGPDNFTVKNIPEPDSHGFKFVTSKYLVDSEDELLLVHKYATPNKHKHGTFGFGVYKLENERKTWTKVRKLRDRALFVGPSESISVSTEDSPWLRPNCIYFLNDFESGMDPECQCDNGIFNLEKNCIESLDPDLHLGFSIWYQQQF